MILCIDVGNTNIKYAVFDRSELKVSFRVSTDLKRTSDEYGAQITDMLSVNHISAMEIKGGIFSSVVPSLDYTIEHMPSGLLQYRAEADRARYENGTENARGQCARSGGGSHRQ